MIADTRKTTGTIRMVPGSPLQALIIRSSRAFDRGRWIICLLQKNGLIESDDLAARRGTFATRKAAVAEFEQMAKMAIA